MTTPDGKISLPSSQELRKENRKVRQPSKKVSGPPSYQEVISQLRLLKELISDTAEKVNWYEERVSNLERELEWTKRALGRIGVYVTKPR